ncbi:hypothetical protein NEPAR06_1124 [Nematocida parisii]|nr:hypothetical protein NEPAR08_0286 [Nematocida parisii]KAI5126215.1 hypothetical protein NEPAR03_0387 [Nematocida parisii]KAI5140460.1 hypothetical protein NEPAR04_0292 [Nematocida parisii]KAI5154439.1 hypothetical protein NEPAR06_1124 [Nematocida parisii]
MERVKVFLRVKGEKRDGSFMFSDNSVIDKTGMYDFDRIFYGSNQDDVFQSVSPLISMALNGYSTTVFTYGQTGSGKTYTMEGTEESLGLIPLTIKKIYSENVSKVTLSVIEVYNEKIYDLLSMNQVNVRESTAGVVLDRIQVVECNKFEEAMEVFRSGIRNRTTGSNGVNSRSSRSHMVFTISLEKPSETYTIESKITLVDLAGSEKLSYDSSVKSEREDARQSIGFMSKRLKTSEKTLETSNINKSLLCLSRIISTLSADSKAKHINYRDSKLTFILRDSLSQNSNLAIIGTVDPEDQTETKSTISFLSAAKKIKLTPQLKTNEKVAEKLINQIKCLTAQNQNLKDQLSILQEKAQKNSAKVYLEAISSSIEEMTALIQRVTAATSSANRIHEQVKTVKLKNNELGNLLFDQLIENNKKQIFQDLNIIQDIKITPK